MTTKVITCDTCKLSKQPDNFVEKKYPTMALSNFSVALTLSLFGCIIFEAFDFLQNIYIKIFLILCDKNTSLCKTEVVVTAKTIIKFTIQIICPECTILHHNNIQTIYQ